MNLFILEPELRELSLLEIISPCIQFFYSVTVAVGLFMPLYCRQKVWREVTQRIMS
jgi:hypothetical protein